MSNKELKHLYSYTVSDLRYTRRPEADGKDSALTLVSKNVYSFDYLMVFCNASQ